MKKFDTVFRGYDKYQVQRFLDDVIKNYEALLNKSKKTEEENKKLIEQIAYYQRIEETMNRAIYNAENAGDQIKSTARKEAETLLDEVNITVNKNTIPFDKESPFKTSGIRLGSPAMTTRGLKEEDFVEIGNIIVDALNGKDKEQLKLRVKKITDKYPLEG